MQIARLHWRGLIMDFEAKMYALNPGSFVMFGGSVYDLSIRINLIPVVFIEFLGFWDLELIGYGLQYLLNHSVLNQFQFW